MTITGADVVARMRSKRGVFAYDHQAASGTRFGQSTHSSVMLDYRGRLADCSGSEIGALVDLGWRRYTAGFPESSGDMARWAVQQHPELLLWSNDGRGKFHTLDEALAVTGACVCLNGFVNGDGSHTVVTTGEKLGPSNWRTIECASGLNGMADGNTARFGGSEPITHVLMFPGVDYGPHTPDIPEEDLMARSAFFAHTDESVDRPGAPGQGPGAVWWLLFPDTGTRMHVVSLAHRDWLALIAPVRPGGDGKPDRNVIAVPASYLYQFVHATA